MTVSDLFAWSGGRRGDTLLGASHQRSTRTGPAAARCWSGSSMKRRRCPASLAAAACSSLVAPLRPNGVRGANRLARPKFSGQKEYTRSSSNAPAAVDEPSMDSLSCKRGRRQRSCRPLLSTVGVGALALAAVVGGVIGGVPMADAVMTEAQCVDATLLGTEEELAASPRDDTATEAVAAGIDRTVVASQETYERLILDQIVIKIQEGPDLPALRNLWSDRTWIGTTDVIFEGAVALADFEEGNPPEFNCMNEHYEMEFVKGEAGENVAHGKLTSTKVVNWSVLKPLYTNLDGIDAFEPTSESVVGQTTVFVAAQDEEYEFHYFLSQPAAEVDQSTCPEPCTGDIITYYWSMSPGNVYLLDRASTDADPTPCWLPVFYEVEHGPPVDGMKERDPTCLIELLEGVEESRSTAMGGDAVDGDGDPGADSAGGSAAVLAAVIIPVALVCLIGFAFLVVRHQRGQRVKKMRTTDEAWGQGLDGRGMPKKQAVVPGAAVTVEEEQGGGGVGVDGEEAEHRRKSFSPPKRAFTDISMEDNEDDVKAMEGASGGEESKDGLNGDAIYPLDV